MPLKQVKYPSSIVLISPIIFIISLLSIGPPLAVTNPFLTK
jgi:hypothetical protein